MVHFYFYTQSYIHIIFRNNLIPGNSHTSSSLSYHTRYILVQKNQFDPNGPRASASSCPVVLCLYFLLGSVPVERLYHVTVVE